MALKSSEGTEYHTESWRKSHGELSGGSGCVPHTVYNPVNGQGIISLFPTNSQAQDTQAYLSN